MHMTLWVRRLRTIDGTCQPGWFWTPFTRRFGHGGWIYLSAAWLWRFRNGVAAIVVALITLGATVVAQQPPPGRVLDRVIPTDPPPASGVIVLVSPAAKQSYTGDLYVTALASAARVDFYVGNARTPISVGPADTQPPRDDGLVYFGIRWTPTVAEVVTVQAYACAVGMPVAPIPDPTVPIGRKPILPTPPAAPCIGTARLGSSVVYGVKVAP